jgi:hypothetical protein
MMTRLVSLGVLVALLGAFVLAPLAAGSVPTTSAAPAAQAANPLKNIPIRGTIPGVSRFRGTFSVESFEIRNGELAAVGTLTGRLRDLATGEVRRVSRTVALPVEIQQGRTCRILHLELGPLDLNLLGLIVHLDRVHLRITADPRRGILGSLLCGLAGGPPTAAPARV